MAKTKSDRNEFVEAAGTMLAANTLAIQLLVLLLERKGALEPDEYADMLASYLDSDMSAEPGREAINAVLADLCISVSSADDLDG